MPSPARGYGRRASPSSRPSGAVRRSRHSCVGTRRLRSTAATRCGTATCSSASLRPLPPPSCFAPSGRAAWSILNRDGRYAHSGPFEIARVPASRIARDHGVLSSEGRPMGNVAVLGACVRLLLPDGLGFLEQAIAARMGAAAAELNLVAAREGYARCTRQRTRTGDSPDRAHARCALTKLRPASPALRGEHHRLAGQPHRRRGRSSAPCSPMRAPPAPSARSSARREPSRGTTAPWPIDYLYCKGCGICEVVCPVRNAIAMEEVPA